MLVGILHAGLKGREPQFAGFFDGVEGGEFGEDVGLRGGEVFACFGVSRGAVEAAIAQGATSLAAVGATTRAGTNCGSCLPELNNLITKTLSLA